MKKIGIVLSLFFPLLAIHSKIVFADASSGLSCKITAQVLSRDKTSLQLQIVSVEEKTGANAYSPDLSCEMIYLDKIMGPVSGDIEGVSAGEVVTANISREQQGSAFHHTLEGTEIVSRSMPASPLGFARWTAIVIILVAFATAVTFILRNRKKAPAHFPLNLKSSTHPPDDGNKSISLEVKKKD